MAKLRVGLLFGGKSTEHEVSLQGARNVYEALDKNKYDVTLIGIDRGGHWHLEGEISQQLVSPHSDSQLTLSPGAQENQLTTSPASQAIGQLDVVFPVLHGSNGEDGTVQGLLQLLEIPFVGSGVLGSAVAMDKDTANILLSASGLPVAKWMAVTQPAQLTYQAAQAKLGTPLFIKPSNAGSSVGVAKVANEAQFNEALNKAFQFDTKVLIEQAIVGRELEVAVLGNDDPIASLPGEIILHTDFYSYDAKYIHPEQVETKIPAELEMTVQAKIQAMAVQAFKALNCQGMARVDFFLTPAGELLVNEVNTIPGFTNISMYPKLWEASGLPYGQLIDRLIELALERHATEVRLHYQANLHA